MKKVFSVLFTLTLVFSFLFTALPAQAVVNLDPCQGADALVQNGDTRYKPCLVGPGGAGTLIRNIVIAVLVISAVVALLFLIWGGFKWITSGGDKAKVDAARQTIIAAIIGLIIAFLAYFILSIVLGLFGIQLTNLKIPKLTGDSSSSAAVACADGQNVNAGSGCTCGGIVDSGGVCRH